MVLILKNRLQSRAAEPLSFRIPLAASKHVVVSRHVRKGDEESV